MTNTQPKVNPTSRYSVRETCEYLQIHRHTLARYVELGYIREKRNRINGRAYYTGLEIIKLFNR